MPDASASDGPRTLVYPECDSYTIVDDPESTTCPECGGYLGRVSVRPARRESGAPVTGIDLSEPVAFLPDGTPITVGLHSGIPADVYHQLPGFTQSMAKVIRDSSPAHLRWQMDHPQPSTAAQQLGSAIHDCVLLPDAFAAAYLRGIEGDGRTRAVKEAREALQLEHPEAVVLKPEDFDTCLSVRDAIARHPKARQLLTGDAEQSAIWIDERTGLLCRGRFDLLGHKTGTVVDLKSTQSAAREAFSRAIWTFGYHIQSAHYLSGAKALGLAFDRFAFVAVEKTPPFAVALYEMGEFAINDGARELEPLMDRYAQCVATGEWPGYSPDVEVIDLPAWAPSQINARLGEAA